MGLLKPTIHTGGIHVVYRTIPCPSVCRPSRSPPCTRSAPSARVDPVAQLCGDARGGTRAMRNRGLGAQLWRPVAHPSRLHPPHGAKSGNIASHLRPHCGGGAGSAPCTMDAASVCGAARRNSAGTGIGRDRNGWQDVAYKQTLWSAGESSGQLVSAPVGAGLRAGCRRGQGQ